LQYVKLTKLNNIEKKQNAKNGFGPKYKTTTKQKKSNIKILIKAEFPTRDF